MKTLLIPREARFFPSKEMRIKAGRRVEHYSLDHFENLQDWFYFIHIDPAQRYVHAVGMLIGIVIYLAQLLYLSELSLLSHLIFFSVGTFFFYGLGIVSHVIYDYGTAKSEPKNFLPTYPVVIKFNLLTLIGRYDQDLRRFVARYPFAIEAFDLIEIPKTQLLTHLLAPVDTSEARDPALAETRSEA